MAVAFLIFTDDNERTWKAPVVWKGGEVSVIAGRLTRLRAPLPRRSEQVSLECFEKFIRGDLAFLDVLLVSDVLVHVTFDHL